MKFTTHSAPHWLGADTVPVIMRRVLYALTPAYAVAIYALGLGMLWNLMLAIVVCCGLEVLCLWLRDKPIASFATDGSAIVTAALIAIAIPPAAPWFVTLTACVFAIAIAKHVYGGLGYNVFNPAMVGYVVVLVSFPESLAVWSSPDSLSGATPLDRVQTELGQMRTMSEILAPPGIGLFAGGRWGWINVAALAGGLWMLRMRVIRLTIPGAMLGTIALLYGVFWAWDPATHPSPLLGLMSGGTMIGAFFVATDPVSAATTDRGRWIYGAGIGALTFAMRSWGAYPDGIAFAVLLMNMAVPLIDRYTLPRVYGHRERP